MQEVLWVTIDVGRSFFTAAFRETIAQRKFEEERISYGLRGDIDYVAGLLLHSAFFGSENPNGIWGLGLERHSEMEKIKERIARECLADQEAQMIADKILLHFGFFNLEESLSSSRARWFKSYGGELYARAAQVHQPPLRDQLNSMSGNIVPWAEVLRDLKRRESILLNQ